MCSEAQTNKKQMTRAVQRPALPHSQALICTTVITLGKTKYTKTNKNYLVANILQDSKISYVRGAHD